MRQGFSGRALGLGAGFALLVLAAACTETGPTTSLDEAVLVGAADFIDGTGGVSPDPTAGGKTGGAPDIEFFEVCKRWDGTPGVATFDVSDGTTTTSVSTDDGTWVSGISAMGHNDWTCRDVYIKGGAGAVVTVTETAAVGPNPYALSDVSALATGTTPTIGADFVTGLVDGATPAAVTAFFTNRELVQLQGCTPGYWKQSQHFGSWTAPWAPGNAFSGPFTSPGSDAQVKRGRTSNNVSTQLSALNANQGYLAPLTRHTMAAVLNAANPNINYPFQAVNIINTYNAAVASGDAAFADALKTVLANANEIGCPVGLNP